MASNSRDADLLIPKPFEYHSPETLAEAVELAQRYREDFKFLAGGQSLLPLMKLRILSPRHVIDLNRLKGLSYIKKEGGAISVGALTRMSEVESSEMLRTDCPVLSECASQIGDPLVRNMGTIGGNISHADPTNDIPAVLVAAGGEVALRGPSGDRSVKASDFFVDAFTTAIGEGEVVREVRIPSDRTKASAYVKLERQPGDFGIVGVATCVKLAPDGRCQESGIGLTGVGPRVIDAHRAAESLLGNKLGPDTISNAGILAAEESSPVEDLRGSSEYKRQMVSVMTGRALRLSLARAKGRADRK